MTASRCLSLREVGTKWKWAILPGGGILFALTVIFDLVVAIAVGGILLLGGATLLGLWLWRKKKNSLI